MPPQQSSSDPPSAAGARRRSPRTSDTPSEELQTPASAAASVPQGSAQPADVDEDIAGELSFREAQTALELTLAELQASDLDVEQMAGLYRRASRYADRCEQLLERVEQEVMQWDPGQPEDTPQPYQT